MAETHTVVAALKFQGGVIITADSQVSDLTVGVRWPLEKLERIGQHPLVVAFSGSSGRGEKARQALQDADFRPTTFQRAERVKAMFDSKLRPIYQEIQENSKPPFKNLQEIALTGLAAFWGGGEAHILEREMNGDSYFHPQFHAIGSGGSTAYAVFRTLGGTELSELEERKGLMAILRIVRTSIYVDLAGVSEPVSVFVIKKGNVRQLVEDEVTTHMQAVAQWEQRDRERFLKEAI